MDVQIESGSIQNPYQEFVRIIPAGETRRIDYAFNFWRILSATGGEITLGFGGSGSPTVVSGAGIGQQLPVAIPFLTIRNSGATALTITVAMAIGDIRDDRLNISGALSVAKPSNLITTADATLVATVKTSVLASDTTRNKVIVVNNTAGTDIRIGDTNISLSRGALVKGGQSIELAVTSEIFAISAGTPVLSFLETKD